MVGEGLIEGHLGVQNDRVVGPALTLALIHFGNQFVQICVVDARSIMSAAIVSLRCGYGYHGNESSGKVEVSFCKETLNNVS